MQQPMKPDLKKSVGSYTRGFALYLQNVVEFGNIKHRSIYWQGREFALGTPVLQIQRPNQ